MRCGYSAYGDIVIKFKHYISFLSCNWCIANHTDNPSTKEGRSVSVT
jgi:hypothetical protein